MATLLSKKIFELLPAASLAIGDYTIVEQAAGGTRKATLGGVKQAMDLDLVENTTLSTWVGSDKITTVGAVTGTSFNSITGLATASPSAGGTASVGTSTRAAREDHVHPLPSPTDIGAQPAGSYATLSGGTIPTTQLPSSIGGGALFSTDLPDTTMSQAVGGAPAQTAATWETKTLNQILGDILFPTSLPTYTPPTLGLSPSSALQGAIYEVGQTLTATITVVGAKNDAGVFDTTSNSGNTVRLRRAFTPPGTGATTTNTDETTSFTVADGTHANKPADIADQFGYTNPNNPNIGYRRDFSVSSLTLQRGTYSWTGTATFGYAAGLRKKDNKGTDDSRSFSVGSSVAPQASSTSLSSSALIREAIYPWFWGKSATQPTKASIATAIASGSTARNLSSANGTLSITFGANSEFIWFAVPPGTNNKTRWYVNETNQGNIESTGLFAVAGTTQLVNAPKVDGELTSRWNGVEYQIYISNFATTTAGVMQIRES